jgi:hypothetical protein
MICIEVRTTAIGRWAGYEGVNLAERQSRAGDAGRRTTARTMFESFTPTSTAKRFPDRRQAFLEPENCVTNFSQLEGLSGKIGVIILLVLSWLPNRREVFSIDRGARPSCGR